MPGRPTRKQCFELMDAVRLPQNIRDHSILVTQISLHLAAHLNGNGCKLDPGLVEAGALLHDIAKGICLKSACNHAEMGAAMVRVWGYDPVAIIVREHITVDEAALHGPITESLLVNYADKRIKHDQLVNLESRFHDLVERYARTVEHRRRILQKLPLYRALEGKIFAHLPFSPADLGRFISPGKGPECFGVKSVGRPLAGGPMDSDVGHLVPPLLGLLLSVEDIPEG